MPAAPVAASEYLLRHARTALTLVALGGGTLTTASAALLWLTPFDSRRWVVYSLALTLTGLTFLLATAGLWKGRRWGAVTLAGMISVVVAASLTVGIAPLVGPDPFQVGGPYMALGIGAVGAPVTALAWWLAIQMPGQMPTLTGRLPLLLGSAAYLGIGLAFWLAFATGGLSGQALLHAVVYAAVAAVPAAIPLVFAVERVTDRRRLPSAVALAAATVAFSAWLLIWVAPNVSALYEDVSHPCPEGAHACI